MRKAGEILRSRVEDYARLIEEGVDSVHALAFFPTPRLFFNTRYSLQCICDWQDQALLLTYFGAARAQLFRERLGIRGVPTLVVFKGGREVARQVGAAPKSKIEQLITNNL